MERALAGFGEHNQVIAAADVQEDNRERCLARQQPDQVPRYGADHDDQNGGAARSAVARSVCGDADLTSEWFGR